MEPIEPVWLFGAIALACGIFIGMLIDRMLNPSAGDVDQLKADLEKERAEMERYKQSVNSHFNKTSDLVKDLTQDYVKVYRHLAEGAQTLSDTREFTQMLEQPRGKVLITVDQEAEPAGAESARPGMPRDDIENVTPAAVDAGVASVATGKTAGDAQRVDSAAAADERRATDAGAVSAPSDDEDAASAAADEGDEEAMQGRKAGESAPGKDAGTAAAADESDDGGKDASEDAAKKRTQGAGAAARAQAAEAATDTPGKT